MDLIESQVVIYRDDSFRYESHFFSNPIRKPVYKGSFQRDFSVFYNDINRIGIQIPVMLDPFDDLLCEFLSGFQINFISDDVLVRDWGNPPCTLMPLTTALIGNQRCVKSYL